MNNLILSWDFSEKDRGILLVIREKNGNHLKVINSFMDQEAKDLVNKLIGREKKD